MLHQERLDGLWDFADPAGSQARLTAAVAAEPDPVAAAELTTQVARALGLQDRFADAEALLDEVHRDAEPTPVVVVRTALERGRLRNSAGRAAEAVPLFEEALTAARAAGLDFLAVDAAHMLAIADADRSADRTRQALALVDAADDPLAARWRGALHNNLGWSLHDAGEFDAALEQFWAALTAFSATGTPEQVRVARWTVARGLRSVGRYDEALEIQRDLKTNGPPDPYVDEELEVLLPLVGREGPE